MTSFFLNPWILAAIAAVVLPPVIEWLFRRRKRRVDLPTIRFLLDNQEQKKVRRQDQLLLLLRMAAIGLLVFGIARPLWKQDWLDGPRQRNVILLLDGTASMNQQLDVSTAFGLAQRKGAATVRALPQGTAVTVATFSDRVNVVADNETDLHTVAARIESLRPGCGAASAPAAIRWASGFVKEKKLDAAELYVLSDFQKQTWQRTGGEAADAARSLDELGKNFETFFVDVGGEPQFNLIVTQLRPSEFVLSAGMPVTFQATIEARGQVPTDVRSTATFLVDGVKKDSREVSPGELGGTALSFEFSFPKAGEYLVEVVVDGDRHRIDNRRQYLCKVPENARVLVVDDSIDTAAPVSDFFRRAIRPPTHPGVDKLSHFDVKAVHPSRLSFENLSEYVVVVLAATANVTEPLAAQLERFADDGGAVWFFLGDAVNAYDYQRLFFKNGAGLLPCALAESTNVAAPADGNPITLAYGDTTHAALAQLGRAAGSGEIGLKRRMKLDLSAPPTVGNGPAQVNGNEKVDPEKGEEPLSAAAPVSAPEPLSGNRMTKTESLLKFSDGVPAIVERPFGRGRALLANLSIDPQWSFLPALAEYPVLIQGVLSYLVGEPDRAVNLNVGDRFEQPVFVSTQHLLLRTPSGEPVRLTPEKNPAREGDFRVSFSDTSLPGVYELDASEDVLARRRFVVNHDASEGDLDRLAVNDVNDLFPVRAGGWLGPETALDEFTSKLHTITELAPWLLAVLAAVLAAESYLAWRFGRRRAVTAHDP